MKKQRHFLMLLTLGAWAGAMTARAAVSVENSRMFYEALKAHQVPAELLEFPQGNHGYSGQEWDAWQKRCVEWLREMFKLKG